MTRATRPQSLLAGLVIPLVLAGCGKEAAPSKAATAAVEKTTEKKLAPPEAGLGDYATPPGDKPVPALMQAASRGNIEAVKGLLADPKTDPNEALSDGLTALHNSVGQGMVEMVKVLLEKGANVDARQAAGATPLHLAAFNGNVEIATLLLDHKADVNAKDKRDQTPLVTAALAGKNDMVLLLLQRGAEIDAATKQGGTALHAAVNAKSKEVVTTLLAAGAKVNVTDIQKYTPLHHAARNGNKGIAELLVQHGADVNLLSVEGGTAFQLANFMKHQELTEYLHKLEVAAGGPASKAQPTPQQPQQPAPAQPPKKKKQ